MKRQATDWKTEDRQLELGFGGVMTAVSCGPAQIPRAEWWFDRMRRAVAGAIDWSSNPPARPEQAHLGLPTFSM